MELSLLASSAVEKEAAIQRTLRHQIEFMATLVHELRNPLGPILHAANLICVPHQKADTLQNMHQIIERQVNHISRLLEDVFDISRISSGKMQLVFEKINLSVLLNEIVEFFKIQTLEVGPLISFDLIKTPIFVLGDNVRLTQIFSNLLDNARKYTPQSGKIVVSVEVDDLFIVVTIADTGIGMSPDALNHIFDMFVQESEAMSFNGKGLGIGLALVQELIHAHGGSVTADSKGPNLGSTFKLSLPRLINIEG